jgi:glycosyltransferase involved in cell wall biosynthesis
LFPSISVVTPSLNQGDFIERTIWSVLSQDIPRLEYVIIDGGSSDETLKILGRLEGRLRWVSEEDKGQADAVNKGIRATKGEIIGWLNSDDIFYPGALQTVLSFFDEHAEVDIIYGGGNHIDIEDRIIESYYTLPWDPELLKSFCFLCQPAVFFRRSLVNRFGLLDERLQYCLDYEFWLRVAAHGGRFAYIRQTLAATRLHPVSKTLGLRMKVINETLDMLHQRLGYVPDEWLLSYARVFLNRKGERRLNGGRLDTLPPAPTENIFARKRLRTMSVSAILAASAVFISLFASLRWNRRITRNMLRILAGWIRSHGRVLIRRVL